MNIDASWQQPIKLEIDNDLIFKIDEDLPAKYSCYIFFRKHGTSISILYIGKAANLKNRIKAQLNNLKLMNRIKNSGSGKKFFIYCILNFKQGQDKSRVLQILEQNLIRNAFLNGHELINIQGTRIPFHKISFEGNKASEKMFGRKMLAPHS